MIRSPHQKNVALAPLTTLGVGGVARWFVATDDESVAVDALREARALELPTLILGGGSNIVIHDEGFDGLVLQLQSKDLEFIEQGDHTLVRAGAGILWDDLVDACVERGLSGVEAMSGIPGHAGAACVQNIGAYGQEVGDTVVEVRVFDRLDDQFHTFSNADCRFRYRQSIFKDEGPGRFLITQITLALRPNPEPQLNYRDLIQYFQEREAPTVATIRDAVRVIRASKGMVYSEDDADSHSVGSFFMNPIVTAEQCSSVKRHAKQKGLSTPPTFLQADGRYKLSAAWLIERAGIQRGERLGGAAISSRHVLAITNPGEATSADVRALADHVQNKVQAFWGVQLLPEATILPPR